jgi:hypothetical protein
VRRLTSARGVLHAGQLFGVHNVGSVGGSDERLRRVGIRWMVDDLVVWSTLSLWSGNNFARTRLVRAHTRLATTERCGREASGLSVLVLVLSRKLGLTAHE